jgi:MFS transporter, PPP family, 3-phenylpropionic acid transporter
MSSDSPGPFQLSSLTAAIFFGIGVYMPFFPVWLAGRGLGPAEIGLVLAVPMLVRVVASAPMTGLADGRVGPVPLLAACSVATGLGYGSLAALAGAWPIAVAVGLTAIAQSPLVPLADVITMDALRRRPGLHYGRIRVWGSVSFMAANLVAGAMLGWVAATAVPLILAASFVAAAIVASRLPGVAAAPPAAARASPGRLPLALVLVIAAASLVNASHAVLYGFGSLDWAAQGYASTGIGLLWAVGVLSEVVVFWLAGSALGATFPGFLFLALGCGAAALRWLVMAGGPGPLLLTLLQASHGATFGMVHLGSISVLAALAPPDMRARCQGLLVAASALALAAGMALAGPLYRGFGNSAFLAMVPVALLALALALVARLQPHKAEEGGNTVAPS